MLDRRAGNDDLTGMANELDELDREFEQIEDERAGRPRRSGSRVLLIAAALVLLAIGGAVAWYAYQSGVRTGSEVAAPTLRPEGPAKVRPEDPGGMAVPHLGVEVFGLVDGSAGEEGETAEVEQLLPPPEDPMRPPAPTPAPVAGVEAEVPDAAAPPADGEDVAAAAAAPPSPPPELTAPAAPPTVEAPEIVDEAVEETPAEPQVAAPTAAPAPEAAPTAAPTPDGAIADRWRIQIAAVRSRDGAQQEWSRQVSRNEQLLSGLQLEVQQIEIEGRGTLFRVRGGPLESRDAANALCNSLKARDVPCIIVAPGN